MGKTIFGADSWVTIGRDHHPGCFIPACVLTGHQPELWERALVEPTRLKLALLGSQNASASFRGQFCPVIAPAVVFLPGGDATRLMLPSPAAAEDRLILFHPRYIFDLLTLEHELDPKRGHGQDSYLLARFSHERDLADRIVLLEDASRRSFLTAGDEMRNELEAQPDGYWPCRARSFLLQLLIACAHLAERQHAVPAPGLARFAAPDAAPLLSYLALHLDEKLTVDRLAREFRTNRTSLQRRIRAATAQSVAQYLIRLRVQTASILLRNTALTLPEVMARTGFADETHFCRAFKKHAGLTPAEFRKQFLFPEYLKTPKAANKINSSA